MLGVRTDFRCLGAGHSNEHAVAPFQRPTVEGSIVGLLHRQCALSQIDLFAILLGWRQQIEAAPHRRIPGRATAFAAAVVTAGARRVRIQNDAAVDFERQAVQEIDKISNLGPRVLVAPVEVMKRIKDDEFRAVVQCGFRYGAEQVGRLPIVGVIDESVFRSDPWYQNHLTLEIAEPAVVITGDIVHPAMKLVGVIFAVDTYRLARVRQEAEPWQCQNNRA